MPISFRDVLQMECLARARIVAGQKGMDNEVRWITVGEEPDLPDWVFGGELVCSTLFAVEPDHLGDYVKGLRRRGCGNADQAREVPRLYTGQHSGVGESYPFR